MKPRPLKSRPGAPFITPARATEPARRIQLPELFDPEDTTPSEAPVEAPDERCVLLVTRSPALKNFLTPIFRREGCHPVMASSRDEVVLALREHQVDNILVAQDMVEEFSGWTAEGGLAAAGAEVSVLTSVSATLLDNPAPYAKTVRAVLASVQLLADERVARTGGSAPYALIARDVVGLCRTYGLRRIATDGAQIAAWLLTPPAPGTVGPFCDLATSITTARALNFPWRIDTLIERMRSLYAGETHPGAPDARTHEIDIAAQILSVVWYRHAVITQIEPDPAVETDERVIIRQRLRAVTGRLASLDVIETYLRQIENDGQAAQAGERLELVLVTTSDDIARSVSASFGRLGARVVHLRTMAEARPFCEEAPPAAVVIDFGSLGMEAARLAVVLRLIPNLLLYALVDAGDPSVTLDLIDAGFDDVLSPPHDFGVVAARVARAVRLARRSTARDSHGGFRATFAAFSFVDLVQSLAQSRKSVRIDLTRGDGEAAMIHMNEGRLVHARAGSLRGAEAVYRVIAWEEDGSFTVEPVDTFPAANVAESTEALLMEGCRLLDESRSVR